MPINAASRTLPTQKKTLSRPPRPPLQSRDRKHDLRFVWTLSGDLSYFDPRCADAQTAIAIIFQFLIETASLSLFGTAIGVVVGLGAPPMVAYFSGMDTVVTPWSVLVAAIVSLTVGIIFGIYPARQAAKLNPIEALRHS